jgi:hypothetical protein
MSNTQYNQKVNEGGDGAPQGTTPRCVIHKSIVSHIALLSGRCGPEDFRQWVNDGCDFTFLPECVDGPTRPFWDILELVMDGYSLQEIAQEMEVNKQQVIQQINDAMRTIAQNFNTGVL